MHYFCRIPEPKILTLDANDEHVIYEIPDNRDPKDEKADSKDGGKDKKVSNYTQDSYLHILLGNASQPSAVEQKWSAENGRGRRTGG